MTTYTLRYSQRAKYVRIVIRGDGTCTVTAPRRASKAAIEELLKRKADWIEQALEKMKNDPRPYSWLGTPEEFQKYKSAALRLAQERLAYFNQFYGFRIAAITIRNQRTRWGSCSSAGRLSFSYKIALLPLHLADYIIVHELCHLQEMNHAPRFWNLVAQTVPDYRERRHELKYGKSTKS